jgi:AcrR family transcriptional regulator
MDVLAKEAGVARATVYEHFRSKRAVLDELAASAAQSVTLEAVSSADIDPLRALRDTLAEVCRHWAENESTMKELRTLAAMTGGDAAGDAIDPTSLRKLVDALATGGHLRAHWNVDDAADALAVLTSYATYERLRLGGRSPEQVESLLARLAISIVSPGNNASG